MRKLIALSIAALLVLGVGTALAAETSAPDVPATLTVGPMFSLEISTGDLSFGSVAPGETVTNRAITATVKTNQDRAWDLRVKSDTALLTHTDAITTLPSFQVWTLGSGNGSNDASKIGATSMSTSDITIYSSAVSEQVLSGETGLTQDINFALGSIGQSQKTGDYSANVTVTLIETD